MISWNTYIYDIPFYNYIYYIRPNIYINGIQVIPRITTSKNIVCISLMENKKANMWCEYSTAFVYIELWKVGLGFRSRACETDTL